MPHLQFEINKSVPDSEKKSFAAKAMQIFSEIMDTGTDHIGVTFREYGTYNLAMGRAENPEDGIAFVNADIREGRTIKQRRKLALAYMDEFHHRWGVPYPNIYVIFTEHNGEGFHLHERYLSSWQEGEDPLED